MATLYSADYSNIAGIRLAIANVALAAGVVPNFTAVKIGEVPLPQELQAAGYPFFAVRIPDNVDYVTGGRSGGGAGGAVRGVQHQEPVWQMDAVGIWPYSPSHQNYGVVEQAMTQLKHAFDLNYDLLGSCELAIAFRWRLLYKVIGQNQCLTVYGTIQAFENLQMLSVAPS